jgi:hypothetical protein
VVPDPHKAGATPEPIEQRVRPWRGRGGAGNFEPTPIEEVEAAEKEELEKARKLEEAQLQASVDQQLKKPSQAHVKVGEKAWDVVG